jgi:hypothetical protein
MSSPKSSGSRARNCSPTSSTRESSSGRRRRPLSPRWSARFGRTPRQRPSPPTPRPVPDPGAAPARSPAAPGPVVPSRDRPSRPRRSRWWRHHRARPPTRLRVRGRRVPQPLRPSSRQSPPSRQSPQVHCQCSRWSRHPRLAAPRSRPHPRHGRVPDPAHAVTRTGPRTVDRAGRAATPRVPAGLVHAPATTRSPRRRACAGVAVSGPAGGPHVRATTRSLPARACPVRAAPGAARPGPVVRDPADLVPVHRPTRA